MPGVVNGTMPGWQQTGERNPLVDFVDHCLRGVGQVCSVNNPVTGPRRRDVRRGRLARRRDLSGPAASTLTAIVFAADVIEAVLFVVGLLVASRIVAVFALVGSAVGMLTGLALGASGAAPYAGLWGYNSFDACLAIAGVLFVLT